MVGATTTAGTVTLDTAIIANGRFTNRNRANCFDIARASAQECIPLYWNWHVERNFSRKPPTSICASGSKSSPK